MKKKRGKKKEKKRTDALRSLVFFDALLLSIFFLFSCSIENEGRAASLIFLICLRGREELDEGTLCLLESEAKKADTSRDKKKTKKAWTKKKTKRKKTIPLPKKKKKSQQQQNKQYKKPTQTVEIRGGARPVKQTSEAKRVVANSASWSQDLVLEVLEGASELRVMLCREKRASGRVGTSVVAACGIFVADILDAVPIDKYFELFKPGAGGEGGFVRIAMSFYPDAASLKARKGGAGAGGAAVVASSGDGSGGGGASAVANGGSGGPLARIRSSLSGFGGGGGSDSRSAAAAAAGGSAGGKGKKFPLVPAVLLAVGVAVVAKVVADSRSESGSSGGGSSQKKKSDEKNKK